MYAVLGWLAFSGSALVSTLVLLQMTTPNLSAKLSAYLSVCAWVCSEVKREESSFSLFIECARWPVLMCLPDGHP